MSLDKTEENRLTIDLNEEYFTKEESKEKRKESGSIPNTLEVTKIEGANRDIDEETQFHSIKDNYLNFPRSASSLPDEILKLR